MACCIVVNTCGVLADRSHGTVGSIADDAVDYDSCRLAVFSWGDTTERSLSAIPNDEDRIRYQLLSLTNNHTTTGIAISK